MTRFSDQLLDDLMREMGIARQSLYDTFGDKRALYIKAMAFYRERTNSSLRQSLISAPTVKEGFTRVLLGLVAETRDQHARGCLLLSANMERAVDDEEIARFLDEHPLVKLVLYPGLPTHPQHEIALRQQRGFGAMISFDVVTLLNAGNMLNHVKICSLAESLGGVETLISHPATMTHASVPAEVRQRIGITDGLIRISVGIEDVADLIGDLDQALRQM